MSDFDALKVFFLYPHVPEGIKILKNIVFNEYEAYQVDNHYAMLDLTREFRNSLLFVNLDYKMKPDDWILYMKSIFEDPDTAEVKMGAVSQKESFIDPGKISEELSLHCGIINLCDGIEKCTECILNKLYEYNAKGRRKYLRARCEGNREATFNIKYRGDIHQGIIHDISSAGIACSFSRDIEIPANAYIDDLQLRLNGKILKVSGKVLTAREAGDLKHVILFDYRKTYREKEKIHEFIFGALQREMQKKVEEHAR